MSKLRPTTPLLLALLVSCSLGCRRTEAPAERSSAMQTGSPAAEREAERERVEHVERGDRDEEQEREGDSEEAKEAAEEARMRQRALQQLQAYRARNCAEAIAKITELLRTQKDRWLERDPQGRIPGDLVQTLTQAELWGAQSESLCKDDPARSHLDDLRNLMATIWQYPRSVPRQALEQRLRVLG